MNSDLRKAVDRMERAGYLPALRAIARACCAPFWWHGLDADGNYRILHNGTVCFLRTRSRLLAVTAKHVFDQYVQDLRTDLEVRCQLGSATVQPEKRVVAESTELDLVTFEVSEVQVGASGVSAHAPLVWPTHPVRKGEVLLYGGFPGSLRAERFNTAELPFQWFAGAPLSITNSYVKLHLDLENFHQPLNPAADINLELGGMSGGPVFRLVPAPPIERLELVGFITESQATLELVLARPSHCLTPDGLLDHDAAA